MKKALIHKTEIIDIWNGLKGCRVCQVEPIENIFDVAPDLFWVDCEDHIKADEFWFDPIDNTIKEFPIAPITANPDKPSTEGTTTL